MNARYNAVIVGQTGVGKSSLINYLYGETVAKAGVGKPVTQNGFHPIDFELNGLPIRLFDSWGLEVDKLDLWLNELDNAFKERGVTESADKWFHSAFYCINAGGHKIQDCDLDIIKKFVAEKYKISVILTKCDQISEEDEATLKKVLQDEIQGLSVISVCSEEKTTRMGTSKPFGKEDVERQAFNDFFDSLILRLPLRCESVMQNEVDNWAKENLKKVAKDLGVFGTGDDNLEKSIKNSASEVHKKLSEIMQTETENTFKMYGNFSTRLGYPRQFNNYSENENATFEKTRNSSSEGFYDGTGFFEGVAKTLFFGLTVVPIAAWVLYNWKDDVAESLSAYIFNCKNELNKSIEKQIKDLTKMLESLKSRAAEQKLLN